MPRRFARLLCCLLALAVFAVGSPGAALPQRAYVWQRAWTPALRQSLPEIGPTFAALDVLAAEISFRDSTPAVSRITPDWVVLKAARTPIGLVVRIGSYPGSWAADAPPARLVIQTCREVLAEARRQGLVPAGLQLDFDAATARLVEYRGLLQTVRREVAPSRLEITTLPDWLRSPDFPALIRETDSYVLQVHSLEKPRAFADAYTLCDVGRAEAWIAQAAQLKHPFRIALPAYGYRLVFDAAGNFAALEAEGPAQTWPAGHQTRLVMADHEALAHFVQRLLASPPPGCEGLAWFRFPIPDDELAWSWPTLRAVMQGTPPEARLKLLARPNLSGSFDLAVTNLGTAAAAPVAFRVEWPDALLVAADTLGGWQLERVDAHTLIVRPPPFGSNGQLRPGESVGVGWLRLARPAPLTVTPIR
ncbi:MAG TPA: DUF3142 domain-containing protein [Lacunisphaera sp.]|nr:DUF3142 domain-containing protein [Lacunisphaera sp.]